VTENDLFRQELRRGTVVMACLLVLHTPEYGYQLLEDLRAAGIDVDGNTLYPLLRRLEKQGLLVSDWNTEESRPRKYYATTPSGRKLADALAAEWRQLDSTLSVLMKGNAS
jgi:DNA-binding PadR family transcriptional regulator